MRDIKFRAWDKDDEKLLYFGLFDLDTDYLLSQGKFIRGEVMQCTGLKDKNGVEIYEGDIFRFYSPAWSRYVTAEIKWMFDPTMLDCEGEVIGNIYSNPELLNSSNGKVK